MPNSIDYAAANAVDCWLHHPVCGDPSFDAFERHACNPIHVGEPPYEWTVNGSLFFDAAATKLPFAATLSPLAATKSLLFCYVGLYPQGYWPPGGAQCYRSDDGGRTWADCGVVLNGPPASFAGCDADDHATPDVHVTYHDDAYHMAYDWANRVNDHGGIAYARAENPLGPWKQHSEPIHLDVTQPPIFGRYVRTYAASLFHRPTADADRRVLVLTVMSSPGNAGGTWALAALTAPCAEGPWSEPRIVLAPQLDCFLPAPVEYFPCFLHEEFVYAIATSVARNRSYQVLFRAPLDRAHEPDAWSPVRTGSLWHDEPVPHEAVGIWGQTPACVVQDGTLYAMHPSKNADDCGTISISSRSWDTPFRDGFVLSAPNAPALGVLERTYDDVSITTQLRASGSFSLLWGHTAAVGPNRTGDSDGYVHERSLVDCYRLHIEPDRWTIIAIDRVGNETRVSQGAASLSVEHGVDISLEHRADRVTVRIDGFDVWTGALPVKRGRLALVADTGCILRADRFLVDGAAAADPIALLPTDATMGAGVPEDEWSLSYDDAVSGGVICRTEQVGARAKWNWYGRGFRLALPRGNGCGRISVIVDGKPFDSFDLSDCAEPLIVERALDAGYHALALTVEQPPVIIGSLEYMPENRLDTTQEELTT